MKRILLASLLAAGVALPGVASAHSYGSDRYGYEDNYRHNDRWNWEHRHHRDRDHWRAERRDRHEWHHHYRHHDRDWRY